MAYGDILNTIFQVGQPAFSQWTFFEEIFIFLDSSTHGLLIGAQVLVSIQLVYQKTETVAAVFGLQAMQLGLLRYTYFNQVSTMLFYIIIMIISVILFRLFRGKD